MTAPDVRTAAQRRQFESIEEMMNDPDQRSTEVKVAHRYGYWMIDSGDEIDAEEIAEADAYLEAHIQHRIAQALVTPTREQIAEALWGFPENTITLTRLNELAEHGEADYRETRDYVYAQADAVLALMQEPAGAER